MVFDKDENSKIKWPVLGIFGDQDRSISVNDVINFERVLNSLKIPNEIHTYKGVGHAFANPSGDNYAPKENADAGKNHLNS
ncbi:MAG: dienelactone hydrolase family protein [Nitrososphaeraceae archaeon]